MRFFICLPTGFAAKKFAMRKTCFAAGSLGLFPTPGEGDFLRSGVFFGVGAVGRRAGPARAALFSAVTFAAFFAAAAVLREGGRFGFALRTLTAVCFACRTSSFLFFITSCSRLVRACGLAGVLVLGGMVSLRRLKRFCCCCCSALRPRGAAPDAFTYD
jgi:hypothetical protein